MSYPTVFLNKDKWSISIGMHHAPEVCALTTIYFHDVPAFMDKVDNLIKSLEEAKAAAEDVLAEQRTLQLVQKGEVA